LFYHSIIKMAQWHNGATAKWRNGKIQKISLFAYLDIEPLRLYDFKPLSR